MRNIIIVVFLIAFMVFGFGSCKETIITWEDNSEPGRRDYVWTVDTIKTDIPLQLASIWGTGPDNIWVVGLAADSKKQILKYNNAGWEIDEKYYKINPFCIFGLDNNRIWIAGGWNRILKYKNNQWEEVDISIPGYNLGISDIWGTDENNLFAVGGGYNLTTQKGRAFIFKYYPEYDSWHIQQTPEMDFSISRMRFNKYSNNYYIEALDVNDMGINNIYLMNGNKITKIKSGRMLGGLEYMNGNIYFWSDKILFRCFNDVIYEAYKLQEFSSIGFLAGTNEKDLFVVYNNDKIGHFNGADVKTMYDLKADINGFNNYLRLQKDVYFVATKRNHLESYIIHGKLLE